jgi:hypothetical protein
MFHEQNKIDAFLGCGKCNQKFDEPRNLSCGNTVCDSCIKTLVKTVDQDDNSLKCSICHRAHKNVEFPVNEIAKRLMETMPTEVFAVS